ncbi:MAG TPA: response regulator transcription factor [Spirochaetia bacterium]|nr:response regulator transcription factor [Spirochaetia bacterium]
MPNIRILIADDHALVRAGMRSLLSGFEGIQVVGEAGNGRDAVELSEHLGPDVVLMDISMSGLNGLDAAEQVLMRCPRCKIIILSMHSNDEYVTRALRMGAKGYLIKDSAASELEIAVRTVARGEKYLSPEISTRMIDQYIDLLSDTSHSGETLTVRQREILQLIAEGRTTREIAVILKIGVKTVETYRTQLMDRLDIHRVADLVRYAIRTGMISPDT